MHFREGRFRKELRYMWRVLRVGMPLAALIGFFGAMGYDHATRNEVNLVKVEQTTTTTLPVIDYATAPLEVLGPRCTDGDDQACQAADKKLATPNTTIVFRNVPQTSTQPPTTHVTTTTTLQVTSTTVPEDDEIGRQPWSVPPTTECKQKRHPDGSSQNEDEKGKPC